MIFLTVGTQLPFDRMVTLVDNWANKNPEVEIFAQIGDAGYVPRHMPFTDYLSEHQYEEIFSKADVILAHAAMGSVISSLLASKPVIVFPRKASLGEHRNEHQLATCKKLEEQQGCFVTYEPDALFERLDNIDLLQGGSIAPHANSDLLDTIDRFIAA